MIGKLEFESIHILTWMCTHMQIHTQTQIHLKKKFPQLKRTIISIINYFFYNIIVGGRNNNKNKQRNKQKTRMQMKVYSTKSLHWKEIMCLSVNPRRFLKTPLLDK